MIKANFRISKETKYNEDKSKNSDATEDKKEEITQAEFEQFIIKSGAAGSFMVFRSDKKDDELGLEEI